MDVSGSRQGSHRRRTAETQRLLSPRGRNVNSKDVSGSRRVATAAERPRRNACGPRAGVMSIQRMFLALAREVTRRRTAERQILPGVSQSDARSLIMRARNLPSACGGWKGVLPFETPPANERYRPARLVELGELFLRDFAGQLAHDDHRQHLIGGHIRFPDGANQAAVKHHTDAVGKIEHVVDVVADQEDTDALGFELL